jgi:hypothetical protein
MSAPPIDDQQETDHEAQRRDRPEHPGRLVGEEISDQAEDARKRRQIDDVPPRQHDRRSGHIAVQLQERDDRTREGDRTDRDAEAHLDPADRENLTRRVGDVWKPRG